MRSLERRHVQSFQNIDIFRRWHSKLLWSKMHFISQWEKQFVLVFTPKNELIIAGKVGNCFKLNVNRTEYKYIVVKYE